jgi:zinc/manganese transport system substrate-binding protein
MQSLVDQDDPPAITIDSFQAAGDDQTRNEHIFYDFVQVQDVAAVIASAIETVDPSTFDQGQANFDAFKQRLEGLTALSAGIMDSLDNRDVVLTEPVAAYLLTSMGFFDVTPASFTRAIEEEREVPPLALKEVRDKITYALIGFLALNPSTVTAQTEALRKFALANGVAVLEFGELPPASTSYIDWMSANVVKVRKLVGIGE